MIKFNLIANTPTEWVECVLKEYDKFLVSHADCERKVSSMAMSYVAKYPDRTEIISKLIDIAIEELTHFKLVYNMLQKRKISLNIYFQPDDYVNEIIKICRNGRDERFIDRMICSSIIENRACERFKLLADAFENVELKKFYKLLYLSEAKHSNVYIDLLLLYFNQDVINSRLEIINKHESKVMSSLPIRPSLL